MGRKNKAKMRNIQRKNKLDQMCDDPNEEHGRRCGPKDFSKNQKKQERKGKNKLTLTRNHKWYLVKVIDSVKPTKKFLEDSFKSMIDTEFTMLGFHQSTTSVRFYLEDSTDAAEALKSLHKRMPGTEGTLLMINVEPCKNFVLLNAPQIEIVNNVLLRRLSGNLLDLTNFHRDEVFMQHNLLPVLWDPAVCRQVMVQVKQNLPSVRSLVLSKNGLRLTNIRTILGSLKDFPLERINMEENDIENFKELLKLTKSFSASLVELKILNNPCFKEFKDPIMAAELVRIHLRKVTILNGQDIMKYFVAHSDSPSSSRGSPLDELIPSMNLHEGNSVVASPVIDKTPFMKYLEQYFLCIDSPNRSALLDAFTPEARYEIQSLIPAINAEVHTGHQAIGAALSAMPATKHAMESFKMNITKLEASVCQVEIEGQVLMSVRDEPVTFIQKFNIIPYNGGLGCSDTIIGYR